MDNTMRPSSSGANHRTNDGDDGPHSCWQTPAMDNLGVTLGSWKRYEESVVVHHQVLESREKMLGPTHVDTLTTMNNLEMALLDLGHADKAKELIVRVYE